MRVLFDQGTPVPLRQYLAAHQVSTAFELDWGQIKNGELLGIRAGVDAVSQAIDTIASGDYVEVEIP